MSRRLLCLGAVRRLAVVLTVSLATCAVAAASASAALTSHGQLLRLAPHLRSNTNSSSNWFGYNQGTLEQGSKLFNSITGDWTVPTATQHTSGQAEDSSDWIGIGGGLHRRRLHGDRLDVDPDRNRAGRRRRPGPRRTRRGGSSCPRRR